MKTTTSGPQRLRGTVDKRKPQSNYTHGVQHLPALVSAAAAMGKGVRYISYDRASWRTQKLLANSDAHRNEVAGLGVTIDDPFDGRCMENRNSRTLEGDAFNQAIGYAIFLQCQFPDDLVVVGAKDLTRFMRGKGFNRRTNAYALPSEAEKRELLERAGGVILTTLIDPDSNLKQIKRAESMRRANASSKRNGRPPQCPAGYKKRTRMNNLRIVAIKRLEQWPWRKIAELLNIAPSTIRGWPIIEK